MDTAKLNPEACTFCSELLGLLQKTNYGRLTGQHTTGRILWRNDDFALIPSLGPLVEGHLLLIPKHHDFSFANLSKTVLSRAEKLIASISQFFSEQARQTLIFEHGAIIQNGCAYERRIKKAMAGACTDHAHVHLVPGLSATPVICEMERMRLHLRKRKLRHLCELPEAVEREFPYVIIGGSNIESWVLYVLEELPSQFMRQLVASLVGLKEWNWSQSPRIHLVQKTVRNIGPLLIKWLGTRP